MFAILNMMIDEYRYERSKQEEVIIESNISKVPYFKFGVCKNKFLLL